MRQLWLFLHLLGAFLWLGGAFAAMVISLSIKGDTRDRQGYAIRLQGQIYRLGVLPGSLATVVSGLALTLALYGGATGLTGIPHPLLLMQAAGLLAGVVTIVIVIPTSARLTRIDPAGEYHAVFDLLRKRLRLWGAISGMLGLLAVLGAAMWG